MPIVSEVAKSPKGVPFMHARSHGAVGVEDARALMTPLRTGGAHQGMGLLAVVGPGTEISSEARKVFAVVDPERNEKGAPTALVVPSAPVRVMMGFIFKMAGASERSRVFASEADAKSWFFSKLDARQASAGSAG